MYACPRTGGLSGLGDSYTDFRNSLVPVMPAPPIPLLPAHKPGANSQSLPAAETLGIGVPITFYIHASWFAPLEFLLKSGNLESLKAAVSQSMDIIDYSHNALVNPSEFTITVTPKIAMTQDQAGKILIQSLSGIAGFFGHFGSFSIERIKPGNESLFNSKVLFYGALAFLALVLGKKALRW